jgi:hypothetical protein
LSPFFYAGSDSDYWQRHVLAPEIAEIAAGSFKPKNPPQIVGSGYVVRSLEAALWAFHSSSSFREGALRAVNRGNDADTTGAIYGQLAGAFYGESEIPPAGSRSSPCANLSAKWRMRCSNSPRRIRMIDCRTLTQAWSSGGGLRRAGLECRKNSTVRRMPDQES